MLPAAFPAPRAPRPGRECAVCSVPHATDGRTCGWRDWHVAGPTGAMSNEGRSVCGGMIAVETAARAIGYISDAAILKIRWESPCRRQLGDVIMTPAVISRVTSCSVGGGHVTEGQVQESSH